MPVLFKASDTFIIQGRGLVLSGLVVEGTVRVGMVLTVQDFPRKLTIDGVERINTLGKAPHLIGLVFHSTDQQEMVLWKGLDVKGKVFEILGWENFMKVVHQGRGGYIEIEESQYPIEHLQDGHFCIYFPGSLRHQKLQAHLDALTEFAHSQEPKWYVENRTRLVTTHRSPETDDR